MARRSEQPAASSASETPAGRDADTVELFAGFLQESLEGLDQVDQILLQAEQRAASAEQVNALFRVFHTIKGVSAFLGADDVKALSHVTETLLGKIREGSRELSGRELQVIFEATAQMRRLLGVVRQAVEADREIPSDAATAQLNARIEQVTAAHGVAQASEDEIVPAAAANKPLSPAIAWLKLSKVPSATRRTVPPFGASGLT